MPMFQDFRNLFAAIFQGTNTPSVTGTTETSIMPTGMGTRTIPANRLRAGSSVRVIMRGVMNSPLVGGTMTMRVKINGTVVSTGTSVGILGSLNKAGWALGQTLTVRTDGTSGTAVVAGDFSYPSGALSNKSKTDLYSDPQTPFAFNTTIDNTIDVTVQYGLSNHQVWTSTCTVEILDPN